MSNNAIPPIPTFDVQTAPSHGPTPDSVAPKENQPDRLAVDRSFDDATHSVVQPGQALTTEPTKLLGDLEKGTEKVGLGGYSDVYRGTWISPTREKFVVAIKVLRELPGDKSNRNTKRVLREGAIWQMAQHKNIVKFYGVKTDGDLALVSEWCSNGCLLKYLESHPDTSFAAKLRFLKQAGEALVYMHHELEYPIYHGDIKPENVLVKDNGEAAFCDLGVSRVAHALNWTTGLTSSNPYDKGSKGYQAPEVLDPTKPEVTDRANQDWDGQPSGAADVYAFGSLILAVLSGRNPFYKLASATTLIHVVVHGRHPDPTDHPQMPTSWWDFLKKCWSRQPENRPSMREVVDELQRAIDREMAGS